MTKKLPEIHQPPKPQGMSETAALPDLTQFLTPSLFENIFANQYLAADTDLYALAFPALQALSKYPLSDPALQNLSTYLPSPTGQTPRIFPRRAIGFIYLLDQGPRQLFADDGTDRRWLNGFFDVLTRRLVRQLFTLPAEQLPDSPQRYQDLLPPGVTADSEEGFEYLMRVRMLINGTLAHSEEWADQLHMMERIEAGRVEVETRYNVTDPSRELDEADSHDVLLFSRMVEEGPPSAEEQAAKPWLYRLWWARVFRAHPPIIQRFGRYPYRNGSLGRESTEEEKQYMKETKGFGDVSDEAARKIKEDVEAGRWTPLMGKEGGQ